RRRRGAARGSGCLETEGAAAFVTGDGSNKPKGFLSYTTIANASWVWGDIGYIASGAAANPGVGNSMRPGPVPGDAVAFSHTHPFGPALGGVPGPSPQDEAFARNN